MATRRQEAYIKERAKDPLASGAEVARRVGYSPITARKSAHSIEHNPKLKHRIDQLVDVGLDALEKVATKGKNEIAVASAAKTLVETGLGKPRDNKQNTFGDITINVARIDPNTLKQLST